MSCKKTYAGPELASTGVPEVLWQIALAALLLLLSGCPTVRVDLAPIQECDPSWQEMGSEHVAKNFNLHRGRWWNHYNRGQCYLALGLYPDAEADFTRAIGKRDRDRWDARTYGMHFIDYFPHRERGIARYYKSRDAVSEKERQVLLLKAIADLKTSHRHQESSRAKFFINQARKAYWSGLDTLAPVVDVATTIYTNRTPAVVPVKAVDRQSGVAAIYVMRSRNGRVAEHASEPVEEFELVEKVKSTEIEVPVDPSAESTDVVIVAVDILGRASERRLVHIVMDTIAPTAAIELKATQADRTSVLVSAQDNVALDRIIVGEKNDLYDCLGERKFSRVVHGTPKGHELAIHIVDRAGNEVVSSVRLGEMSAAAEPWRPSRPLLSSWPVPSVGGQDCIVWPPYLTAPYACLAWGAARSWLVVHRHASPDRMAGPMAPAGSTVRRGFSFPLHVRPLDGIKETSHDVFYLDGTLYGADSETRIKIGGERVANLVEDGRTRIFSQKISLRDVKVGGTKPIAVEAFHSWKPNDPYKTEKITIRKIADHSMHGGARYRIVVLPFKCDPSEACGRVQEDSLLQLTHEETCSALGGLQLPGSDTAKGIGRFRVCRDIGEVTEPNSINLGGVLRDLQEHNSRNPDDVNNIDLVLCGEFRPDPEERFEIKLEAIDASTGEFIDFPRPQGGTTRVLADVYGTADRCTWYTELLAAKVGQRIPRLKADITIRMGSLGEPCPMQATIHCGRKHGLFEQMKLLVYERKRGRNGGIGDEICRVKIKRPGESTSVVEFVSDEPEECRAIISADVVVAK